MGDPARRGASTRRLRRLVVATIAVALVPAVPALAQDPDSPPPTPDPTSTTQSTTTSSTEPTTTSSTQSTTTSSTAATTTSSTAGASTTTTPTTTGGPTTTTEPDGSTTTTVEEAETTTTTVPEDEAPPVSVAPVVPGALAPEQVSAIEALRGDLEEVTESERDFFDRLLGAQSLIENLNLEIVNLDFDMAGAEADLARTRTGLSETEARVAALEAELDDSTTAYEEARVVLRDWAVEAYIAGGTEPPPAVVLSAGDASEAQRTVTYADALVVDSRHAIDEVVALRQRTRALAEEARRQRDAVRAFDAQVQARQAELVVRRDQQMRARAVVEGAVAEQQALLAETAERRAEYERRIAEQGRVSDGISGALAAVQADQPDPLLTAGIFLPPIEGGRVVSLFGPRVHPIYGVSRMHNGLDIDAAGGTPIRAPGDGAVVIASEQGGYGNAVVLDHGNGIGTVHAHMSALAVVPGQLVRRGDVLGAVGSTGLSTGPHLHFEVRLRGQPIDPTPYLGPESP